MTFKCIKCKKKFRSEYLLNKHINKNISCDTIIKCEKCGKVFDTIFILNRHLDRKTTCNYNIRENISNTNENTNNIQLEIEREITKREIEKNKLDLEKNKIDLEKNKIDLEKLKLKIELKQIESENRKEEIGLRKKKNIEIENMKDKRKEKTATIINNNYTQNTYIEATNYINNNFNAKIVYESKGFQNKEIEHLYDSLQDQTFIKELYKNSNNLTDLLVNVIKFSYNNDNYPEKRYFIYDNNSEKFFEVDNKSGKYKIVKFDDIDKYIRKATGSSYNQVKNLLPQNPNIHSKAHNIKLYENVYIHHKEPLIKPAMIGLDPDNRIIKSKDVNSLNLPMNSKPKNKTNKYNDEFSSSSDEDEYD